VTAILTDGATKPTSVGAISVCQRTLARSVSLDGIGFFSGRDVSIRLVPAEPRYGLRFVRTDLPGSPTIPASIRHRIAEPRRTVLQDGDARVEMTEHVLAALVGMGVDNCRIELDGPEPPGLDGSALPYVEAIRIARLEEQRAPATWLVVDETIRIEDGAAWTAAEPSASNDFELAYDLEYGDNPGIGRQSLRYVHSPDAFADDIAPARTFIRESEVAWLRSMGIGKRTNAADLLVFADDGSLIDNELRFPDECVRHKILDLIGDLALAGRPIVGRVAAHRSGHGTNAALAAELASRGRVETRQGGADA